MSDTIDQNFIGAQLRAIQAEQRTLRMENELIRKELGRLHGAMVTRELVSEVLTVLVNRIANFEALAEARIDQLGGKIDQLGDRLDARLDRIERQLVP